MKPILYIICLLLALTIVYATDQSYCNVTNPVYLIQNVTPAETNFSISCMDSQNITRFDLLCNNGGVVDNISLNATPTYVYNYTTPYYGYNSLCTVTLNDNRSTTTFSIIRQLVQNTVFQVNTCPDTLPATILYLGILFFFLAIVIMCIHFRLGIGGIFGSLAILLYSLFVVGCYTAFGWIFAGIGVMFLLYFGFGRYS